MVVKVDGEFRALNRRMEELERSLRDLQQRRMEMPEEEFLEREISILGEWEDLRSLLLMCRLPIPQPVSCFRDAWMSELEAMDFVMEDPRPEIYREVPRRITTEGGTRVSTMTESNT